jgi:hypothetical protein
MNRLVRRERNFCDESSACSGCHRRTEGPPEPNHRESLRADSLIFDRIRCFPPLARDHLCKIFHYAGMRASSVDNAKRNDQCAQILFRNGAESRLPPLQKSLFHRIFCNRDNAHTNLVARRVRAPMMTTAATRMRRRLSQLARVHVSLSGNAVFFAVL